MKKAAGNITLNRAGLLRLARVLEWVAKLLREWAREVQQ